MINNNQAERSALFPNQQEEEKVRMESLFMRAPGKEDISRREEFVKHFELDGDRRQAIVYSHPVHYRNGNGEWEEIDNTLEEVVTVHGRKVLRNKSNHVHMEFPQEMDGGNMASISCDGKTFAWRFEQEAQPTKSHRRTGEELKQNRLVQKAKGMAKYVGRTEESLRSANLVAEMQSAQEQRMEIAKLHAENRYDEVLPGVSVRYELNGNALKEDIILADRTALSRAAIRLPDEFNYEVTAHQELHALDKGNGELLFTMNTPLVYDAAGKQVKGSIHLTPCSGYTRMEYEIDADFLVSAVWPVTIDPTVRYAKSRSNIEDIGLYRDDPNTYRDSGAKDYSCGRRGDHESITIVRFKKLVKQKSSDTIVAALVGMHPTESHGVEEYMACYPMNKEWRVNEQQENWKPSWNNLNPDTNEYISDEVISYVDYTGSTCYFDITNLYRSWYQKEKNLGVAFRYPLGVNGEEDYVKWAGAARNSENGPCVIVNYLSHSGLESWWQYETVSAGSVGTAHVDLFNGNMVFEHADVVMSGNRMPVSVTHYYNSCLALTNEQGCGMGWRMSVNQSLYKKALTNANWTTTNYYVWTDGDGTEHYFPASGSAPYKDEETKTLELTISGSTATISTKDDTKMRFPLPSNTTKKYITSITDACENAANYTYDANGLLTSITDGAGRVMNFVYTDGLLTQIQAPDQQTVSFTYDADNQLTAINHPNKGSLNLDYANGLLTNMGNVDGGLGGVGIQIGYQDVNSFDVNSESDIESCRVTSVVQTGIENQGSMLCFDYLTSMTKVKVLKSGDAQNPVGKTLSYQFNSNGNLACVFDELGYAKRADFDNYNAQEKSSCMQKAVINLAKGLAFANNLAGWAYKKGCTDDTIAQDTSIRCLAMPSLKIEKLGVGETVVRQTAQVYKEGKHTFSAYIKADGIDGSAFLRVISGNNVGRSIAVQESTTNANCGPAAEGWERVYATVDAAVGEVTLELVCDGANGTVHFACPQLEIGDLANRVNLLTNGDFARTEANTANSNVERLFPADWTPAAGITTDELNGVKTTDHDMPDFLSGNALQMVSFPASNNIGFNHDVPVSGAKGDVFVIGGWLNSRSVSGGSDQSCPCIAYRFSGGKSDGTWKYVEFSREWVGWQFGAWAISAPETYTSFTFSTGYSRNAQTAMFTNLFMYREQFGQSFAYDSKKNLTSVENLAGQKSEMKYDSYDNLTSYVQPGAETTDKYILTYGEDEDEQKQHLVRSLTTPMGVKQEFYYDAHGNSTESKTVDGTAAAIITQTEYDETGNYALKSYDARGRVVSRTINPVDYTLTSVTDPDGQTVSYTYDGAKRVTGVETTVELTEDVNITYKNAYTYENNRIKTVAHNTDSDTCDVVYRFEYDGLGRKTSVKVGNADPETPDQVLSTNEYSTDRSGLLKEVRYGNGTMEKPQSVKYTYDGFDRLEGVSYDGETTPRYSYVYDATGEVAKVVDNHLNRSVETERDLAFRPRQSTLKDAEGNVLYRTTLYYDKMNRLEKFAENVNGEAHTSTYSYDKDNRTTEIKYDYVASETEGEEEAPCDKVTYTYDKLGRIEKRVATMGENNYETTYTFEVGDTIRYGAGSTTALVSKITQGTGENAMNFEYEYDKRGNITDVVHTNSRTIQTTHYKYDALGQLMRVNDKTEFREGVIPDGNETLPESSTWVYEYDFGGNILCKKKYGYTTAEEPTGECTTTSYTYADPNWKDKLTSYDGKTITYDAIGNPLNDGVRTYTWGAGRQLRHISMLTGEEHGIRISNGINEDSNTILRIVYDETNSKLKAKLLRDGRDITDECAASAFAWKKGESVEGDGKEIAVTDAEINGDVQFSCTYTETQGVYGTVSVDNNLVASHDPATADANHVFTLENGMLKVEIPNNAGNGTDYELVDGVLSVNPGFTGTITAEYAFTTSPTREIDFEYDHNGLRTQKKVVENGITTIYDYTLHGKLITHLTKRVVNEEGIETGKEELHFFYDAQSRPAFVEYNGIKYRYVHNLQGDIVAIVDAAGNPVVEYKYDAWGKPIGATPETGIGAINPFRYRSYMWEMEIGWYYLNKRFYDSVLNRFNNVDDIIGIGIGGTNVYAYCVNNPLSMIDPSGRRPISSMRVQDETASDRRYSMLMMRVQAEPIDITERLVNEMEKNYNYLVDFYNERVPKYGALIAYAMTNLEFANKVRTGKEWDLKVSWKLNRYQQYTFNGITISYDDVGNIHFGYVGSAIHNLDDLHIAAGLYQIKSKTSSFSFAKTCFDDPRDYNAVTYGYLLKNKEYITLFGGVVLE